jgi:Concanavalin A-like lectin/glucanases superfamily
MAGPMAHSGMRPTGLVRAASLAIPLAVTLGCSSSTTDQAHTAGGTGAVPSAGGAAGTSAAGATSGGTGTANGGTANGGTANGGNASSGAGATSGGSANGGTAGTNAAAGATSGTGGSGGGRPGAAYDSAVLADQPVAFWGVNMAPVSEPDLTGNGHDGTYQGGTPPRVALPNGDPAADFDGTKQFLSVPSSAAFSIPTTGTLTWEGWIRPDVLQFPHDDGSSGFVDWMGKCEQYGPTCEWEARMYDTTTQETPNRPSRLSAYVFNPSAGLGSAADWQPNAGLIATGNWYHVVGQYTLLTQPSDCTGTAASPGSIDIWVNGVKWDHGSHGQTGCMSQYNVVPKANNSALNIGTMAKDSFFKGAIAKVAIYAHPLSQAQINNHYSIMTGKQPSGSCAATCGF